MTHGHSTKHVPLRWPPVISIPLLHAVRQFGAPRPPGWHDGGNRWNRWQKEKLQSLQQGYGYVIIYIYISYIIYIYTYMNIKIYIFIHNVYNHNIISLRWERFIFLEKGEYWIQHVLWMICIRRMMQTSCLDVSICSILAKDWHHFHHWYKKSSDIQLPTSHLEPG